MPEDYISYLTSDEVGFSSFNQLDIIQHSLQGKYRFSVKCLIQFCSSSFMVCSSLSVIYTA